MISSNDLRHYVRLQKASDGRDGAGSVTKTWTDVATIHARIRTLQGKALHNARQIHTDISQEVTIRYDSALSDLCPEEYRFIFKAKYYDILYVINTDEMDVELVCMCKVTRNG